MSTHNARQPFECLKGRFTVTVFGRERDRVKCERRIEKHPSSPYIARAPHLSLTSMEGRKRKRESDPPRITFLSKDRTFDRLFRGDIRGLQTFSDSLFWSAEESLTQTKEVVRRKLGLEKNAVIHLAQVRDGRSIDLDDGGWLSVTRPVMFKSDF